VSVNITYIADAKFVGDRLDANDNVTTPDGNRVTYVPELTGNLTLEYATGSLRTALNVHHTSSQYTDVENTTAIAENTSGFFMGRIDSYTVLDLTMVYDINSDLSVNAAVKNIADENYIASLRQGIYVGPERSFNLGVRYRF
jgi:Fe(3+) dicitrate transport protein